MGKELAVFAYRLQRQRQQVLPLPPDITFLSLSVCQTVPDCPS